MILPLIALFAVAALAAERPKKTAQQLTRDALIKQARDEIQSALPPGYVADRVTP